MMHDRGNLFGMVIAHSTDAVWNRAAEAPTAILIRMRSVADDLRSRSRAAVLRLAPLDRVRLALELGDADARRFATMKGLCVAEARRTLSAARRIGRVVSVANDRTLR